MHLTEEELIARYLENDPEAVGQIGKWIAGAAASFRRRLGPDMEDAVQQTHLRLIAAFRRGEFRSESKLRVYVAAVTSHTCIDMIRRDKNRPAEDLAQISDLPAKTGSPEKAVGDAELCLRIWQRLAPEQRECLTLYVYGMSYGEMSQALNEREGTLRKRVHDCHEKVREIRAELDGGKKGERA